MVFAKHILFLLFSIALGRTIRANEASKVLEKAKITFERLQGHSALDSGNFEEFFRDPALKKLSTEDRKYIEQSLIYQKPSSHLNLKVEYSKLHVDFATKNYLLDFSEFTSLNPKISINGNNYSLELLVNGALSGTSNIKAQLNDLQKWHNNSFHAQVPLWLQIILFPLTMTGCTPKSLGSAEASLGGAALHDAVAPQDSETPRTRALAPNAHGAPTLEAPAETGRSSPPAATANTTLEPGQRTKLINYIAQNEFAGNWRNSVDWNTKESFPSLGMGHYIWYPIGKRGPFEESFPQFIKFAKQKNPNLQFPDLLNVDANGNIPPAPWATKSAFVSAKEGGQLDPLIQFLQREDIKQLQLDFQMEKLKEFSSSISDPKEKQLLSELKSTPNGLALLIHYRIFKGDGMTTSERYTHQGKTHGWGLKQVIEEASKSAQNGSALEKVKDSALKLLTNRAKYDRTTLNVDENTRLNYIQSWTSAIRGYGSIL